MKKTDKTSDKRGKKSGEIAEDKLDKVAGGAGFEAQLAASTQVYQTSVKIPTIPKPPIIVKP